MSRVRVHNFALSLDGFGVGEGISEEEPFGHAGTRLHEWMFATRMGRALMGREGGTTGTDDDLARATWDGVGAEIMGRHKFHTGTGELPPDWHGPWGANPPFHTPVIVLTHHPRPPIVMEGGTTFHFRDAPPATALDEARRLAGGLDVRLGGGVRSLRDFLDADLVDDLHLVVVPVVLGRGQRLWTGSKGSSAAMTSASSPATTASPTSSRPGRAGRLLSAAGRRRAASESGGRDGPSIRR
ncbi:dihydrofolate reductase family protein [Mobilicoccus massiliensis]|uniref:dihydrofolate reductase family protein n=1 Tax=Mobilicoccus massiliensis TaxID=1522310 RepID=UPI0028FCBA3A|nr:dihydrofolate reductase family protein [Mobilicoccus massiliensis]